MKISRTNSNKYTYNTKIEIFNKHLVKDTCSDVGLDYSMFDFSNDAITHLIETYTNETGVRGLKRKLEKLMNKINLEKLYGKHESLNAQNKKIITPQIIDQYLEKPSLYPKKIFPTSEVGIINGLYASNTGPGGILPILIYRHITGGNKFKLKLTGQQKSVMKESIIFSFTIATNLIKNTYIEEFLKLYPKGLHIHTPDGSTPKDGPSAGCAFTTAFVSRILNKKIKNNIAMTGEIETNGNVTAIGGLECKLLGAKKAGVNLVLVPQENEPDFNKIIKKNKTLIDDEFRVIIVNNILDILEYALIDDKIIDKLKTKNITYEKTFNCSEYIINN